MKRNQRFRSPPEGYGKEMARVLITAAIALSLALGGCLPKSKKTSCSDALGHFYAEGCAIFIDEEQLSEREAVDGCKDEKDYAADVGCKEEYQDLLDCLEDADICDECNYEFDDYNYCIY